MVIHSKFPSSSEDELLPYGNSGGEEDDIKEMIFWISLNDILTAHDYLCVNTQIRRIYRL